MKKLLKKTSVEVIFVTVSITGLIVLVVYNSIIFGVHSSPW
jgi:hypothetical protein